MFIVIQSEHRNPASTETTPPPPNFPAKERSLMSIGMQSEHSNSALKENPGQHFPAKERSLMSIVMQSEYRNSACKENQGLECSGQRTKSDVHNNAVKTDFQ